VNLRKNLAGSSHSLEVHSKDGTPKKTNDNITPVTSWYRPIALSITNIDPSIASS